MKKKPKQRSDSSTPSPKTKIVEWVVKLGRWWWAFLVGFAGILGLFLTYYTTAPSIFIEGRVIESRAELTIKNSGVTTAYQTILTPQIYLGDYPPKRIATAYIEAGQPYNLAPSQEFIYPHDILLPNENEAIYATGSVTYLDWLGFSHEKTFSLIYGGPYPKANGLMGEF